MAVMPDDVADFVQTTLSRFHRRKWTDISLGYQEYIAPTLINDKRVMERGGKDISFRLQVRNTGLARNTGWFEQDQTAIEDVMTDGSVPWAMQTVNWSFSIYEDIFQSDEETIIREMQIREHDAMNSLAELNEENLWSSPSSTTDTRPMGIPFWIQKDASSSAGFNGGNPSTHSSGCAGISSTTYPRWRDYTAGYAAVSMDDLIPKIKSAVRHTRFIAPHPHPELGFGRSDYQMFTVEDTLAACERLAESRNDNLGKDLAKYRNQVTIGGVPMKWVPYLTANDSSNPLYGVNWKTFRPFAKKGASMRRNPPKQAAKQHTVREVHIDNWMNYGCYNRRLNFVGSTS